MLLNNMKDIVSKPDGFSVHLTNLLPGDVAFFDALGKLFCDPAYAKQLELFRAGNKVLRWDPKLRMLNVQAFLPSTKPAQLPLN